MSWSLHDTSVPRAWADRLHADLERLPSRSDLRHALGLETRWSDRLPVSRHGAAIFGIGLLIGAGVALLLAPRSGRELRSRAEHYIRRDGGESPLREQRH
jgi:hypothetical protein